MSKTKDIAITVLMNDEKFVLHTYAREYRNVMTLIRDNIFLEDFGECGGMGRCSTCMIRIVSQDVELPFPAGIEAANLANKQASTVSIRLSCQLMLEELLHNLIVRI